MLTHPIQTYIIMTCAHTDIDMQTLQCRRCMKQFRIVKSKEYSGYLKEDTSLEWAEDETGHLMKVKKNGQKDSATEH